MVQNESTFYILTELVDGPDLDVFIFKSRYKKMYESAKKDKFAFDMAKAISYIHGQTPAIIHQDIKPGNFVVDLSDTDGIVKMIDLGISRFRTQQTKGNTVHDYYEGTSGYMAPEVFLDGFTGTTHSDVWSFGCTLIELFKRKEVWQFKKNFDLNLEKALTEKRHPPTLRYCCHKELITEMLAYDPQARPDATDIVDHFRKLN